MTDAMEDAALLCETAAAELDRAAAHCRTAAAHFREKEIPRAAAHAWAAFGHILTAEASLEEQARTHAEKSNPPRTSHTVAVACASVLSLDTKSEAQNERTASVPACLQCRKRSPAGSLGWRSNAAPVAEAADRLYVIVGDPKTVPRVELHVGFVQRLQVAGLAVVVRPFQQRTKEHRT